jgi:hypothetical protein
MKGPRRLQPGALRVVFLDRNLHAVLYGDAPALTYCEPEVFVPNRNDERHKMPPENASEAGQPPQTGPHLCVGFQSAYVTDDSSSSAHVVNPCGRRYACRTVLATA